MIVPMTGQPDLASFAAPTVGGREQAADEQDR